VNRPTLSDDGIAAILAAERLTEVAAFDLRYDLRFPFTLRQADTDHAVERLIAMIELLNEERDLDDEMARLNARAIADSGLGRYESIEAARQQIRERKLKLRERSFELGTVDTLMADNGPSIMAAGGGN